nr:hypothetical protein [Phenylobacterium sp.]
MPGLVPGIHVLLSYRAKTWMAGTSPAMTELSQLYATYALKYAICVVVASTRPFGDHNSPV